MFGHPSVEDKTNNVSKELKILSKFQPQVSHYPPIKGH
jgi:hypothetical protein